MTTPPIFSARRNANADLPEAVGPATITARGAENIPTRARPDESRLDAVSAGIPEIEDGKSVSDGIIAQSS